MVILTSRATRSVQKAIPPMDRAIHSGQEYGQLHIQDQEPERREISNCSL